MIYFVVAFSISTTIAAVMAANYSDFAVLANDLLIAQNMGIGLDTGHSKQYISKWYALLFAKIGIINSILISFVVFYQIVRGHLGNHIHFRFVLMHVINSANVIANYAAMYKVVGLVSGGKHDENIDFYDAVYFSVVTWTTLGFGDLAPQKGDRTWCAVEALAGTLMDGFLVGLLVTYIAQNLQLLGVQPQRKT